MTADALTDWDPLAAVPRDRWGRPLIVPAAGGKPRGYRRVTTFVGVLEDTYNLSQWQVRQALLGVRDTPALAHKLASLDPADKQGLNALADEAKDRAGSSDAATTGTAVHALCERLDRGQPLGHVPGDIVDDIKAYERATAELTPVRVEELTVHDAWAVAGTPDRVVEYQGRLYIADLKTGRIDYGLAKIAMQLSLYSRSVAYDINTHERTPLDVDQERAIIIHAPVNQGVAHLIWVDIGSGWSGCTLAREVWQWRDGTKGNALHLGEVETLARAELSLRAQGVVTGPSLEDQISGAASPDELTALWSAHRAVWTPAHTAMATARKTHLLKGIHA